MKPDRRAELNGQIVVWIARVPTATPALDSLESPLTASERERAGRYRFPEDRARFVAGRGLLRIMLGRYLGIAPGGVDLDTTGRGRPIIRGEASLPFSVSHSGDFVAIALTAQGSVGIDVEWIKPDFKPHDLAARIFSEEELPAFRALPAMEARLAFFRAWTRKEAYLKARGEGIAEGLQKVTTSFGPETVAHVKDARDPTAAELWRLHSPPLPLDYVACVASDDSAKTVHCYRATLSGTDVSLTDLPLT